MTIVYVNALKNPSGMQALVDSNGSIECSCNREYAVKNFNAVIALENFNVKERALRYHTHRGL